MLALGRRVRRGAQVVIIFGAVAAAAIAGTTAPAAGASLAGQMVLPGPPAVFSWGWNTHGEVGNGTTTPKGTPGPVLGLPAQHGLQIAAKQVTQASTSDSSAVLMTNGTVYTWGDSIDNDPLTPALVPGLSGITQIAEGALYMVAVGTGGAVWSWGYNHDGQLGDGTTTTRTSPARVPGLTGITQLSAGPTQVLALRSDGTVLAWGSNSDGELGDGTTKSRSTPAPVPGLTKIIQVAAGYLQSYALRSDGTLFAWGSGILGNGSSTESDSPVTVPLAGVTQVATSGEDTLAIAGPSHAVYAWGTNTDGEVGNGTSNAQLTPVQVNLSDITQVSEGLFASAAVRSDGSLFTWGNNGLFGLGLGGTVSTKLVPAQVIYLSNVSHVALGAEGGLAYGQYDAATVPSLTGDTQAEATTALQAAGFVLGRVAQVLDITCEFVGEVKVQTPAGGTLARLGTAVNLGIGKAGGKCL